MEISSTSAPFLPRPLGERPHRLAVGARDQLGKKCGCPINAGILTVSDRSFQGIRKDVSGPELVHLVQNRGWKAAVTAIVPDDKTRIGDILIDWIDRQGVQLVLTTGGTGIGPRDVTPEATRAVIVKEIPGLSELMRREGFSRTPLAVLSRGIAGTRGKSLIINFPGSPAGARESFNAVYGVLAHALAMLRGEDHHINEKKAIASG